MKKKLQDVTDYKVMSMFEAIKALGWSLKENEDNYECICNCGNSKMTYKGFIGTEIISCENCGKQMVDLFSPLPTSNATVTVLNPKDYEIEKDEEGYERFWVAEDGAGGIK